MKADVGEGEIIDESRFWQKWRKALTPAILISTSNTNTGKQLQSIGFAPGALLSA